MVRTNSEGAAATSRERTLAGLLRAEFDKLPDVSMRQLATQLGVNHSTLSRWFDGKTAPDPERVSGVLACLGVVGDRREQIMRVARGGSSSGTWVTPGPPGVAEHLIGTIEMESNAVGITQWSPLFVPGQLQTKDYARAIIGANRKLSSAEVEHLVTLRLGRQHTILRNEPVPLTVILGIPAIRGRIGDDDVMIGQLRHLTELVERESITVQLAPIDGGWHGGLLGSFIVYDFAEPLPSIVSLEHHRTGSFVDDPTDVGDFKQLAADLRELAHDPDKSLDLIRQALAERVSRR